jgi:conjugative relaxase-like TrwC/TraI family protein
MLRITQNIHAAGAKSYYSTADYYSEGQELTGRWRGEGAALLGLQGDVKQNEWDALCNNRHPQTGGPLTVRLRSDRTVGYDFNFHVPKSVSLLYAETRDERLLDAFRDAVDGTMHDMEAEMATRVRKSGKNENRRTGNLAWGEFVHFTSRPVDGVPDPHLHAHCFVFNTTWDEQEQAWKAGQFRELKRDAPYFEAVFHTRFAHRLADLGLPIERTAKGWELGGINKGLIEKFSRRTAQIEDKAREMGINDAEAKAELGAKTRERKQKDMGFPELQDTWRSRMTGQELDALAALERKIGGDAEPVDGNAAERAMAHAVSHVFERKSVVAERQLLTVALRHAVGQATVEQVHRQAERTELIVGERNGRRMVTTPVVLSEERRLTKFAREGRGTCKPFAADIHKAKREWLNAGQQKAAQHILQSRDRVMLLRGAAGVGKTSLMQEVVEAVEATGTKVLPFAPSADASRGVLRQDGFHAADTVARFLIDEKLQQEAIGQLIWIDEAGQLGTRTLLQVFDLAEKLDARVLLSGDRRQHGSVERGAALRLLEEEAGLKPAEVKDIQRQTGEYKEAVHALSEGRTVEGFDRLDALGWVLELPDAERHRQLAADYVETVAKGKSVLVVSPTHAEADRVTGEIRRALKATREVGAAERTFRVLENSGLTEAERKDAVNYVSGDVVQFHQNAKGFTRGERLVVGGQGPLPLDQAKRFQLFHPNSIQLAAGDVVRITHNGRTADEKHRLDNGSLFRIRGFDSEGDIVLQNGWTIDKDFGHLTHGYVLTSHASQGKTVHRVFVSQGSQSLPASSREQFYVSASRAREHVTIYTDDKHALREAIGQTDARLSATELVQGLAPRWLIPVRQQYQEAQAERPTVEREGVSVDR